MVTANSAMGRARPMNRIPKRQVRNWASPSAKPDFERHQTGTFYLRPRSRKRSETTGTLLRELSFRGLSASIVLKQTFLTADLTVNCGKPKLYINRNNSLVVTETIEWE